MSIESFKLEPKDALAAAQGLTRYRQQQVELGH
jgi:hypothetical protein